MFGNNINIIVFFDIFDKVLGIFIMWIFICDGMKVNIDIGFNIF